MVPTSGSRRKKERKEAKKLMKGFSWLPVIDQSVIAACQIFNLERSYRINGSKWVLYLISPFMYVPFSASLIRTKRCCDEKVPDDRLATTSLIIGRRIVASINGNPEFDAATMLRPYTYAYVSTPLLSLNKLTVVVVYECHYRYTINGEYSLWSLEVKDGMETY